LSAYFRHVLERIDLTRDIHFYTQTSIDTLDYSGTGLNTGSKVVFAAAGDPIRTLGNSISDIQLPAGFNNIKVVFPGVLAIAGLKFSSYEKAQEELNLLTEYLAQTDLQPFPFITLCDDSDFTAASIKNWVWVTFTRSNPSHDIYGVNAFTQFKHWGCKGAVVVDARIKPHHAPVLERDPEVEKRIERLGVKGASLHGII
jgi:4-hydroxy-3-polyprenylbenzoate decarboxylase